MSPRKKRITIAESCGWVFDPVCDLWRLGKGKKQQVAFMNGSHHHRQLPDYLNDLNAIADAVKYKIAENTDFSLLKYGDYMIKKHGTHGAITASAKQHCEAFLHTINK